MRPQEQPVLDYAPTSGPKPLWLWLPPAVLSVASIIWHWPRPTPTGFPNTLDLATLILLAPAIYVMARESSLPRWAFSLVGAVGVLLFLLANLHDRNFRANMDSQGVAAQWCFFAALGGFAGRLISIAGRAARP